MEYVSYTDGKIPSVKLLNLVVLEHEPDTMAPFLRGLIRRFLASRISNSVLPSNRVPSYTYLQTLDAIKKPKSQESREDEASPSQKYNLESIPGL
jgi:hypothetical protein|uniref:Uncharacterized protein n=1 Tax=Populus trichocarpa TaxID=3694 RepID=A0A2K1Y7C3_POPTR